MKNFLKTIGCSIYGLLVSITYMILLWLFFDVTGIVAYIISGTLGFGSVWLGNQLRYSQGVSNE